MHFLQIMDVCLPTCGTTWSLVVQEHAQTFPENARNVDSLRRQYQALLRRREHHHLLLLLVWHCTFDIPTRPISARRYLSSRFFPIVKPMLTRVAKVSIWPRIPVVLLTKFKPNGHLPSSDTWLGNPTVYEVPMQQLYLITSYPPEIKTGPTVKSCMIFSKWRNVNGSCMVWVPFPRRYSIPILSCINDRSIWNLISTINGIDLPSSSPTAMHQCQWKTLPNCFNKLDCSRNEARLLESFLSI